MPKKFKRVIKPPSFESYQQQTMDKITKISQRIRDTKNNQREVNRLKNHISSYETRLFKLAE